MTDNTWDETLKVQADYKKLLEIKEAQKNDRYTYTHPWESLLRELGIFLRSNQLYLDLADEQRLQGLKVFLEDNLNRIRTEWDVDIEKTENEILDVQIRAGKLAEECKAAKSKKSTGKE